LTKQFFYGKQQCQYIDNGKRIFFTLKYPAMTDYNNLAGLRHSEQLVVEHKDTAAWSSP